MTKPKCKKKRFTLQSRVTPGMIKKAYDKLKIRPAASTFFTPGGKSGDFFGDSAAKYVFQKQWREFSKGERTDLKGCGEGCAMFALATAESISKVEKCWGSVDHESIAKYLGLRLAYVEGFIHGFDLDEMEDFTKSRTQGFADGLLARRAIIPNQEFKRFVNRMQKNKPDYEATTSKKYRKLVLITLKLKDLSKKAA